MKGSQNHNDSGVLYLPSDGNSYYLDDPLIPVLASESAKVPPAKVLNEYMEELTVEETTLTTMDITDDGVMALNVNGDMFDVDEKKAEPQQLQLVLEDGVLMTIDLDPAEKRLMELGYTQELSRVLRGYHSLAIAVSTMSVFPNFFLFGSNFLNGGPVGVVWFWIILAPFIVVMVASLSEIASSFPVAGSLYFWAAALAGPEKRALAAWIVGFLETIGVSVGIGGNSYIATIILKVFILMCGGSLDGTGGYELTKYQCFAITTLIIFLCGLANWLPIYYVANLQVFAAIFQVLICLTIIIVLPAVAPTTQTASYVFTSYNANLSVTGLPSEAYAGIVCFLLPLFCCGYGFDMVAHVAEETKHSDRVAPPAMLGAVSITIVLGWGVLVALLFSIQDPANVLASNNVTRGNFPVCQIIWDAFYARYQSGAGAQVLTLCIFFAIILETIAYTLGASRILFSLARDDGLPFSRLWKSLDNHKTPANAAFLAAVIGWLFVLPTLANDTVFNAIISMNVAAWMAGFAVPMIFRFIRKEHEFTPGPFYLAKYFGQSGGKAIHLVGVLIIAFMMAVNVLPATYPITITNFNYASVGLVSYTALFMAWWFVDARNWFEGPVAN